MYCLFRSLVKHSCINPKSPTFGYLDEKSIDIGLMKFFGLYLSAFSGTRNLPLHSPPPQPLSRPTLSLFESKGWMTPRKSRLYDTMTLQSPWPYYLLSCICVPFFEINRSTSMALWHSSESTSFLTDALLLGS
ncbi:hypothetical protein B296_00021174 [Ensete ventricosum]|uniref:Uncharacterized protein n=1 Tax=Ensete ventricosum TaxID=4639 RepID=A0A426XU65_ENSVE|nr:hypothetical protein B296_00021174 [Ensete ventricosum]